MTQAQVAIAAAAGAAAALAVLAGWRERARSRRRNLDAVGLVAWPTVQMLALIALAIFGILALHGQ